MAVPNWMLAQQNMPNIGQIFMQVAQIKRAQARNAMLEQQTRMQAELPEARASFMQGDPSKLVALAPQEAIALQGMQAKQAAGQREQAIAQAASRAIHSGDYSALDQLDPERGQKLRQASLAFATKKMETERKKLLLAGRVTAEAFDALAATSTPEEFAQVRQRANASIGQMVERGLLGKGNLLPDDLTKEQVGVLLPQIRRDLDSLGDESLPGIAAETALRLGYRPDDVAQAVADPKFRAELERLRAQRQTQRQVVGEAPGRIEAADVPESVRARLFNEIEAGDQQLAVLDTITPDMIDRVAGWANQKKVGVLNVADSLGGEEGVDLVNAAMRAFGVGAEDARRMIEESQAINNAIEGTFIRARQEATGAAFSRKEDIGLRKVFANIEMPPERLKAAVNLQKRILRRNLDIKRKLLANGLAVGDVGYWKAFEETAAQHPDSPQKVEDEIEALQAKPRPVVDQSSIQRETVRRLLAKRRGIAPEQVPADDITAWVRKLESQRRGG